MFIRRHKNGLFESGRVQYIRLENIWPNPDQPRKYFEQESLNELADSIAHYGVLQPLSVIRKPDHFELVAGERRLRACRIAGLEEAPCLIVEAGREQSSLLALVENLQRRDLDYIEEAEGIARLIISFGLSQEEAARRIGKSQSAVANKLRILKHPPEILSLLREHGLTERHARALLRLESADERLDIIRTVAENTLNVAQTEELIENILAARAAMQTVIPDAAPVQNKRKYVIKDMRIFYNTIKNAVDMMKGAGINANIDRAESEDCITLTVTIAK